MTTTIRIAELFGPTFQGEGPTAGQRAAFVRLIDCNLDCSWCDTPHTWDWTGKNGHAFIRSQEYRPTTPDEVLDLIGQMSVARVVVTGGEPLLRMAQAETLIGALSGDGYQVEVETNGTIVPSSRLLTLVDRWNVSPKLSGAKTTMPSIIPEALAVFRGLPHAAFKFVVSHAFEVDEVIALCDEHHLERHQVWLMPEGVTPQAQLERTPWVAQQAVDHGFNFTGRLHTLAWGNDRGH